jgi:hypothetical protein
MDLTFIPPGPVAAEFFHDRSRVSAIMGPMGSGKTSTIIHKLVAIACEQRRSPRDGNRYTKFGVVRDTYTNLKRTTIKSIKNFFKEGAPGVEYGGGGSSDEPPFLRLRIRLADGSFAITTWEFIGLDVHSVEDLAKGWEITGYWLNEADLLDPDVKQQLDGRIGRYPSKVDGGPTWRGGILDYNAPDTRNYLYKMFEKKGLDGERVGPPAGHRLFKQPGGRTPGAENLHNLPENYYEELAEGQESWWVRRNIDAVYGFSRDGLPVYEQYRDDLHAAAHDLEPVRGIVIKIHADAATHPALVFTQTMPNGQLRILDEIHMRGGAVQIGAAGRELMAKKYPGHAFAGGLADPSADKADEKDIEAETWIGTLNRALGLTGAKMIRPAPTNDPTKRQDAVKYFLKRLIDGQPALLVSPRAEEAREGFNSTYRFKKRPNGDPEDSPEKKHPVSDVHDAIQYACLDEGGYEEVTAREDRAARRRDFSKMRIAKMGVQV